MKSLTNVWLIVLLFGIMACSQHKAVIKNTPVVEVETLSLIPDSIKTVEPQPNLFQEPFYNEYSGTLPCADCPGIDYKLILNENGSYTETISYADLTEYQDKSENTYIYDGHFTVMGDTVFLDKGEDAIKYFLIHPQGLLLLDNEKVVVESDFSEKYILKKMSIGKSILTDSSVDTIGTHPKGEVDFYAVGNEPDWRLDINFFDSTMIFKSLLLPTELIIPLPIPEKTNDSKIINYYSETESGTLDVTLINEPCEDTMAGEKFPYEVRVEAKVEKDSEFITYLGCGRYDLAGKLDGTLEVFVINDSTLKEENFENGLPNMRLNLKNNRIYGRLSCNRFSGLFSLNDNEITFQRLLSTGFPCETHEFEDMFFNLLQSDVFTIEPSDEHLVLRGLSGSELKLRKIK